MRSFQVDNDDRRRIYLAFVGSLESQLRELFGQRKAAGATSQQQIAAMLGVNKSVVNRRLNGADNLTAKSIADLVWAMDGVIEVKITAAEDCPQNGAVRVRHQPVAAVVTPVAHVAAGDWVGVPKAEVKSSGVYVQ